MGLPDLIGMKWCPDPLPEAGSYDGKTVLVTGGTTGLGFASAVHFVNLGASEVIITARTAAKGEAARNKIELATGTSGQARVKAMELDMNDYASIVGLVDRLKAECPAARGLDYAVLSAGTHNGSFKKVATGWEEDIQVNALSTTLLGLLLVSWMKELRPRRLAPAHLAFVSSARHLANSIADWPRYAEKDGGILRHFSREESWDGGRSYYSISKLLVMYSIEEVAKLALGPDGKPQVIVNSLCPGPVTTELGRTMINKNVVYRAMFEVLKVTINQSMEVGARIYVEAGLTTADEHAKFLRKWTTDEDYATQAVPNITSKQARKVQALVWKEIREELVARVPAVQEVL